MKEKKINFSQVANVEENRDDLINNLLDFNPFEASAPE